MNRILDALVQRYRETIDKETEFLINCRSTDVGSYRATAAYIQAMRDAVAIIEEIRGKPEE